MKNTAAVICCLAAITALAETREGASVVVEEGEVIAEDLYVTGTEVRILGTVEGDLVAVGGTVELDGTVQGDVLIVAGTTQISGRVLGSVRAVTGQLVLRGKTGEDLSFVSGNALVGASASVGRDVVAISGMTGIRGPVVRDVVARGGQLDVDARVGGSVRGQVTRLWLGSQALIESDVVYASPNALHRSAGAVLNGAVSRQGPEGWSARVLLPVISWLKGLIGLFVFAVLWLTLFPGFSRRAAGELRAEPYKTLGAGALAFIALPIVALAIFAAGSVIGGWWLGLLLLGVLAVALLVSVPLVAQVVGGLVLDLVRLERRPPWFTELVGLVVLGLLAVIPVLGPLAVGAVILLGLGAQALALPGRVRVRTTGRLDQLPESWARPSQQP